MNSLKRFREFLTTLLFGCLHAGDAWPIGDRQRCLICGAWRKYEIRWEPAQDGLGTFRRIVGAWNSPERLRRPAVAQARALNRPADIRLEDFPDGIDNVSGQYDRLMQAEPGKWKN